MDPLVSVEWLAKRLHDPDVAGLDATLPPVGVVPVVNTAARYRARHIPGAVFFDIEAFSDHATTLPHMLPPAETFAAGMGALGISDSMTLVVYEQQGVFSAPRAWWMLRTFGAKRVAVLDGGLEAWEASGQPVSSDVVSRPPAIFHAALDSNAVRNFEQLQGLIANGGQILDARSAGRFAGTAPEPRAGLCSGHMPGATSVPFTDLVADGRIKDSDQLKAVFQSHHIDLAQPITTSCGSGVTAAVLALGLERCGATEVSLYDGSWAEYAQRPEAVIVSDQG